MSNPVHCMLLKQSMCVFPKYQCDKPKKVAHQNKVGGKFKLYVYQNTYKRLHDCDNH